MERSQIERLFESGEFSDALAGIEQTDPCPWCDTMRLRCLRAMKRGEEANASANKLFEALEQQSTPYTLTTSERNNQLRYIALIFAEHKQAAQACEIMQSLCKQSPEIDDLHREYAFALSCNNQLDDAEAELNKALEIQPFNANCHAQLARIYCRTGRVDAGYNSYSKAATIEPHNPNYLQRLIYWNNYLERTTQQSNYQLTRLWASRAHPGNRTGTNTWRTSDADRQLKIAFVSSNFSKNSISDCLAPLLKGLNRRDFHVTVYSDTKNTDDAITPVQRLCDEWRDSSTDSDQALAAKIAADQIDILVDLNGHAGGNRLGVFASHLAPIQLSWLGYPSTTGLKSVDYRITDRVADPIGVNDKFYTEELIRLPSGFLCYSPPDNAPDIAPTDGEGIVRFGSFNSLAKISSLTLDCWAAAMHAVPNSTLYLKRQQLANANARAFFTNNLEQRGINADRLILKTSNTSVEQHLNEYNQIDIALDTSPYNGIATTLEALWMGVPVISLKGQTHASRVSASILERLNLSGLATKSVTEFAERVRELSELDDSRQELRTSLRGKIRQSPLMNTQQFGREFGNALRAKWRIWCQQRNNEQGLIPTKEANALEVAK